MVADSAQGLPANGTYRRSHIRLGLRRLFRGLALKFPAPSFHLKLDVSKVLIAGHNKIPHALI
jgi:hypothetical protein